ncbi:mnd1-interacting protein 1 [Phtheirospermum japonicum]|uniref:Mnd1-interacting protein 1 n=1 Tax=Phtheirospermum japonicum TaxID=374723 RepID=A0A830CWL7_9LAMI|nr:mnd1-interacting protein 1 [Phtheirospermum japonicum]
MDSAKLQKLRMEKEKEKKKNEKICSEMSVKLMEAEQSLRQANSDASLVNDAVKRMEIENDRIRAEIEVFKLNATVSERELKKVLKREKRYTKKLADVEKQKSVLRSQCDEEKQRALQLEQELLQAEKDAKEAEMKWKQTIKEKEEMLALLAHETKNAEIRKAHSRSQLQILRQQVEIDSRLANDNFQRLEDELSRLRMSESRPIEELLPENLDFLYRYDEATSSESSAPCEPSHWICMKNEVSVLFSPCTHQLVCFPCYLKKGQTFGVCCPYCGVGIEDAVKVYGSSS